MNQFLLMIQFFFSSPCQLTTTVGGARRAHAPAFEQKPLPIVNAQEPDC
jgi:hypothetical protein